MAEAEEKVELAEQASEGSDTPESEPEKEKKKRTFRERAGATWQEFKKFISKGNVLDMAVGVIVGSAFSAVVSAVTSILLSLCTWGVPGGLDGLVTVLPAISSSQMVPADVTVGGMALQQSYTASEWLTLSQYSDFTSTISDMYTLHGSTYYYNGLAIIDWGTLIDAVISFIIIAVTLFVIVKVFTAMKNYRAKLAAQTNERIEEYRKHHSCKEKEAKAIEGGEGVPSETSETAGESVPEGSTTESSDQPSDTPSSES